MPVVEDDVSRSTKLLKGTGTLMAMLYDSELAKRVLTDWDICGQLFHMPKISLDYRHFGMVSVPDP